ETLRRTRNLRPDCEHCGMFQAGEASKAYSPACRKTYRDFYKVESRIENETAEDAVIDIRLAIGYMDYLKSVEDAYVAAAFARTLTSKCVNGRNVCGFRQDPDDEETFYKRVRILGPDGKMRLRTVRLSLRSSSVTD